MAFFFLHSVFLFVCFWNTYICGIEADREVGWLTDKQNSHLLVYYLKLDTTTRAGLDQSWENSVLGLLGAAGTTYLDHSLLPPLVHIRRKAATVPGTQVQVPWLGIQTGCLYTWPNAYPKIFFILLLFFSTTLSVLVISVQGNLHFSLPWDNIRIKSSKHSPQNGQVLCGSCKNLLQVVALGLISTFPSIWWAVT